ncbi:MAG: hypothetical protein J7J93_01095 [Candidatus Aenigmarchaeota archaeon]|nr:hypothetical protein [Candidatus Aenigmarchaeota archaeon]
MNDLTEFERKLEELKRNGANIHYNRNDGEGIISNGEEFIYLALGENTARKHPESHIFIFNNKIAALHDFEEYNDVYKAIFSTLDPRKFYNNLEKIVKEQDIKKLPYTGKKEPITFYAMALA